MYVEAGVLGLASWVELIWGNGTVLKHYADLVGNYRESLLFLWKVWVSLGRNLWVHS
jgi:hypothetical protein